MQDYAPSLSDSFQYDLFTGIGNKSSPFGKGSAQSPHLGQIISASYATSPTHFPHL